MSLKHLNDMIAWEQGELDGYRSVMECQREAEGFITDPRVMLASCVVATRV